MAVSKVYNGSSWVVGVLKVYNGSAWVEKPAFYNGSSWVDLYSGNPITMPTGTFTKSNDGGTCYSGLVFRNDGSVDTKGYGSTTYTQTGAGSLWHEDEPSASGSLYDVRCASISSGSWTSSAASTGTWIQLNTDRHWYVSIASKFSPGSKIITCVMEIRLRSTGEVLGSETVTVRALN